MVKNLAEYYGLEVMNLAELMARKQTDPKAFLTEGEAYSAFVRRFYPNAFIEAIESRQQKDRRVRRKAKKTSRIA